MRKLFSIVTIALALVWAASATAADKKIVLGFSPDRRRERLAHRQHQVHQGRGAKEPAST